MAEKKYFPLGEAAEMLQVTKRVLKRYIPELKHGVHYQDRRKKGDRKAQYFFNVDAIVEYWNTKPAIRESGKTDKMIRNSTK